MTNDKRAIVCVCPYRNTVAQTVLTFIGIYSYSIDDNNNNDYTLKLETICKRIEHSKFC